MENIRQVVIEETKKQQTQKKRVRAGSEGRDFDQELVQSEEFANQLKMLLNIKEEPIDESLLLSGFEEASKHSTQGQNLQNETLEQLELLSKLNLDDKPPSYKEQIDVQKIGRVLVKNNLVFDANKNSTSPPSLNIKEESKSQKIDHILALVKQNQNILNETASIQNDNQNILNKKQITQLKSLTTSIKNSLIDLQKQENLSVPQNQQQQITHSPQQFKIINQDLFENEYLQQEVTRFFGSVKGFTNALKFDPYSIFSFIKIIHSSQSSINSTQKTQHAGFTQQNYIPNPKNINENQNKHQRTSSDPKADNQEYLQRIEEKLLVQYGSLMQEHEAKEPIQMSPQRQIMLPQLSNENQSMQELKMEKEMLKKSRYDHRNVQKKPKREKNTRQKSEDKFNKKEFQDRFEKQFLEFVRKQFPCDEQEEEEEKKVENQQLQIERHKFNDQNAGKQDKLNEEPNSNNLTLPNSLPFANNKSQKVKNDKLIHIEQSPQVSSVESLSSFQQIMPANKQVIKGLQIEIDAQNPLEESQDLEDPNQINFFENNQDQKKDVKMEIQGVDILETEGGEKPVIPGGLDTPAFGQSKPDLKKLFLEDYDINEVGIMTNTEVKKTKQRDLVEEVKDVQEEHGLSKKSLSNSTRAKTSQQFIYPENKIAKAKPILQNQKSLRNTQTSLRQKTSISPRSNNPKTNIKSSVKSEQYNSFLQNQNKDKKLSNSKKCPVTNIYLNDKSQKIISGGSKSSTTILKDCMMGGSLLKQKTPNKQKDSSEKKSNSYTQSLAVQMSKKLNNEHAKQIQALTLNQSQGMKRQNSNHTLLPDRPNSTTLIKELQKDIKLIDKQLQSTRNIPTFLHSASTNTGRGKYDLSGQKSPSQFK